MPRNGHLSEAEHNMALAAMQEISSNQMDFDIAYTGKDYDRADRTFSTEGIDRLLDQVYLFVGTRILKEWSRTGAGPKKMRISVAMDFDPPIQSRHPVMGPDGQVRLPSIITP